jgi:ABC-type multidrug transport system fused ATPase/permease subunit
MGEGARVRLLPGHKRTIALCLAGTFLQSVLLLPIPLLQCWVIDQLLVLVQQRSAHAIEETRGLPVIIWAFLGTVACFALRSALCWKGSADMSRVSLETVRTVTDKLHRKFQHLPVSYYDRAQTGRLMARITSDVGTLLIFLGSASIQLVCDLILAIGIAAALLWLEWRLALVSFLVLPLHLINYRLAAPRTHQLCVRAQQEVAALYALLSERISAVRVVRSFTNEQAEIAELGERVDVYRSLSWAQLRTGAWQGAWAVTISGIGTLAALSLGAWLVGEGKLGIGALVAFYTLLTQLYGPLVRLTQFQGTMAATRVALERIQEVLDEPEPVDEWRLATGDWRESNEVVRAVRCVQEDAAEGREAKVDLGAVHRGTTNPGSAISFRNVSFAYHGADHFVLEGIHLDAEPGMKIGILGASGAGKSTLLALIPRIYELGMAQGQILLDGCDIRKTPLADLRRAVVLVPQQALLFEGTIFSNLLYARPKAPPSLVDRVLEVTELADLAASLPRGLETPVGERGFTLSSGQRQRLALARALITEPAVLLLDDCTSALDAETEARIVAALEKFLPGHTWFIVSHKVSTLRHADRIVLLEKGRIIEQGSEAELLALGGGYASLAQSQSQAWPNH